MREIKFKCWDRALKYWLNEDDMPVCGDGTSMFHEFGKDESYYFCQYTGLKDKNGVEIFEGDIVKSFLCGEDVGVYRVEWEQRETRYLLYRGNNKYWHCGLDKGEVDALNITVVGNIHENKELLDKPD